MSCPKAFFPREPQLEAELKDGRTFRLDVAEHEGHAAPTSRAYEFSTVRLASVLLRRELAASTGWSESRTLDPTPRPPACEDSVAAGHRLRRARRQRFIRVGAMRRAVKDTGSPTLSFSRTSAMDHQDAGSGITEQRRRARPAPRGVYASRPQCQHHPVTRTPRRRRAAGMHRDFGIVVDLPPPGVVTISHPDGTLDESAAIGRFAGLADGDPRLKDPPSVPLTRSRDTLTGSRLCEVFARRATRPRCPGDPPPPAAHQMCDSGRESCSDSSE